MSLFKTLAKVAIGVAVAKGMKKVIRGGNQTNQMPRSGGLGDILGKVASGRSAGGLGGLLGGLAGGNANAGSKLDGMLGSVLGGTQANNGGLGGLLDSLGGNKNSGFGEKVNQSIQDFGQTDVASDSADEANAKVLLVSMIQAAKADGEIDEEEKAAITKHLGNISAEDMAFINEQLQAPLDPAKTAASVPNGMQAQAYAMSLLAIDLDNQHEAQYLDSFAKALGIEAAQVNSIHQQMGEPALYS